MSRRIITINTGRGSFLRDLEEVTNASTSTALVPRDYYAIDRSLKETEVYRKEIETQLKHSDFYLKLRKAFKEKLLGKKVKSIEELFDLQLYAMRGINYGLEIINNEARERLSLLEKYIEKINYEYENNFLGIDGKKDSLSPLLREYAKSYQRFNSLTKKDDEYFETERKLRELKRTLSEGSHSYKKMLDVVDDLERERKMLNVLEDFFRYSIQLSERMVEKAGRFENHVANTKDAYLMTKNINCGFSAVLRAVQSSSSNIAQLQQVLTEGMAEMGDVVSDPNMPPYQIFETFLKSRHDTVRSLVNRKDADKEMRIVMEKKGLLR